MHPIKAKHKPLGMLYGPKEDNSIDMQALAGGDKPRHYKRRFARQVGVGFIPTREFAWFTRILAGQSLSLVLNC